MDENPAAAAGVTGRHPFLSDEWIAEARKVRTDLGGTGQAVPRSVRMNQVITEVPFGDGRMEAHIDTTAGALDIELGHLENPDVTITLDYETAKAIFVDGTPEAGMQAFMAGRIRVQGDMAKLIAAMQQAAPPDDEARRAAQRIKDITA